jgi:hypothetical protein
MRKVNHEMAIRTLRLGSDTSTLSSRFEERWKIRAAGVTVPAPREAVAMFHSVWSRPSPRLY